jgi:hypothetical protein
MIICSLHGLFWAADRDETSTTRQSGRLAAVSSRPPIRDWCRGQCSCIAALDRDVFAGAPVSVRHVGGSWPREVVESAFP